MVTIERSERRRRVRAYTYAPMPCVRLQRAFNTKTLYQPTYLPISIPRQRQRRRRQRDDTVAPSPIDSRRTPPPRGITGPAALSR